MLVKIGVYAYARLFLVNMPLEPVWQTVVPVIAAVSALVAAGAALLHLLGHSVVKTAFFLTAGNIQALFKTKKIKAVSSSVETEYDRQIL